MKKTLEIETYIADFPKDVQKLLKAMRSTIKKAAPKATEAIKYGIPTFILDGKNLVHFGGFKKHIGFFPAPGAITAFKKELAKYETSKGTIKFFLDEPLPLALVTKIVKYRVQQQNLAKKK